MEEFDLTEDLEGLDELDQLDGEDTLLEDEIAADFAEETEE